MYISANLELKRVQDLYDVGKFNDALHIVEKIERNKEISDKEQLIWLIFKGKLYNILGYPEEAINLAEDAYQKSKILGNELLVFDALISKVWILIEYLKWTLHQYGTLGERNTALQLTEQLEQIFGNLKGIPPEELLKREANLIHLKGLIFFYFKKNADIALESLNECLSIREKLGNKSHIAETLMWLVRLNYVKGDLDQCITYCEQIIANPEFPKIFKCKAHGRLVNALKNKGDLERAIKINGQWQKIAEEVNYQPCIAASLNATSEIFRLKGDLDQALEYGKQSFELAVFPQQKLTVLLTLIEISLEMNNARDVNNYLDVSQNIAENSNNEALRKEFELSKAVVLKSSTNIRDRVGRIDSKRLP